MRAVEFAEELGEHFLEVEVVVDVREELGVCGLVACPVYAVDLRVVELLLHLLPDVVEDVFPFLRRSVFEFAAEGDAFPRAAAGGDLRYAVAGEEEEVFVVCARVERAIYVLGHDLDVPVLHIHHAEVHASFETYHVVELLAVLGEVVVAEPSCVRGELHDHVLSVLEVECELLGFLLGLYAVLLFLLLFLFALEHLAHLPFFLVFVEFEVGLAVEEHEIDITVGAPASVAAVSVFV